MTTYTGVADANGDFTVPFSSNYTSGQKITVTSEKSGATKSIELYAPSDLSGGGAIKFSGNLNNFPNNIGVVTLSAEFTGVIQDYAMQAVGFETHIFRRATGLIIMPGPTAISMQSFATWSNAASLSIPSSVLTIGNQAFTSWASLLEILIPNSVTSIGNSSFQTATACKKVTLGTALATIGSSAFSSLTACDEIICLRTTPPSIQSNTFASLKATCVIKVPSASLNTYQTATNWSALASKMVGV